MKNIKKLIFTALAIFLLVPINCNFITMATNNSNDLSKEQSITPSEQENTSNENLSVSNQITTQEELTSYRTNSQKDKLIALAKDEYDFVRMSNMYITVDDLKHFSNALNYNLIIDNTDTTNVDSIEDYNKEFFYYYFLDMINAEQKVYVDCSTSMNKTFKYEKINSAKLLMPYINFNSFKAKLIFEDSNSSDIYGSLNEILEENAELYKSKSIIMLTDLWDTENSELSEKSDISAIFFVPYNVTNLDAKNHCDDIAKKLLSKWNSSCVYIAYMDETIIEYNNYNNALDIVTYIK
jgi:hypothetical protein